MPNEELQLVEMTYGDNVSTIACPSSIFAGGIRDCWPFNNGYEFDGAITQPLVSLGSKAILLARLHDCINGDP